MEDKEFWDNRDKEHWRNGKYWLKEIYAIENHSLPKVTAQFEVASKKSIRKRLENEKTRLENRLNFARERISNK